MKKVLEMIGVLILAIFWTLIILFVSVGYEACVDILSRPLQ